MLNYFLVIYFETNFSSCGFYNIAQKLFGFVQKMCFIDLHKFVMEKETVKLEPHLGQLSINEVQ